MNRHVRQIELVARFLASENTLALATATPQGTVSVAPLFYIAQSGLRLYWLSSKLSEHSRNLKENARAAVSVDRNTDRWNKIRGVQMRGSVTMIRDRVLRRDVLRAYTERFHLGKLFDVAISRSTLYCFQPDWVRYIDNSRNVGSKFELLFSGDELKNS
jgi:uncharacterized protein YhbP (UPF0306 family)